MVHANACDAMKEFLGCIKPPRRTFTRRDVPYLVTMRSTSRLFFENLF